MINITKKIAVALDTVGLINIQFAIKDEIVYVIEANPRASRTVPFIAKAYNEPYVNYATKVMIVKIKLQIFNLIQLKKDLQLKFLSFHLINFLMLIKSLVQK